MEVPLPDDPLVEVPPNRHPHELLNRLEGLPVPTDEQCHVVLGAIDDVDIHVVTTGIRLCDRVDVPISIDRGRPDELLELRDVD